jgi:hypothetical protein
MATLSSRLSILAAARSIANLRCLAKKEKHVLLGHDILPHFAEHEPILVENH